MCLYMAYCKEFVLSSTVYKIEKCLCPPVIFVGLLLHFNMEMSIWGLIQYCQLLMQLDRSRISIIMYFQFLACCLSKLYK